MHPATQIADCALADPTAIDIENELGAPLQQNSAGVDRAQDNDQRKVPVLGEVVDDPALQLERHDFEQKYGDSQHHQPQLVPAARFQNVAEYVAGHFSRTDRTCWLPSRLALVALQVFKGMRHVHRQPPILPRSRAAVFPALLQTLPWSGVMVSGRRGRAVSDFKGRHFGGEIVLWAVRWYPRRSFTSWNAPASPNSPNSPNVP